MTGFIIISLGALVFSIRWIRYPLLLLLGAMWSYDLFTLYLQVKDINARNSARNRRRITKEKATKISIPPSPQTVPPPVKQKEKSPERKSRFKIIGEFVEKEKK